MKFLARGEAMPVDMKNVIVDKITVKDLMKACGISRAALAQPPKHPPEEAGCNAPIK